MKFILFIKFLRTDYYRFIIKESLNLPQVSETVNATYGEDTAISGNNHRKQTAQTSRSDGFDRLGRSDGLARPTAAG